MIGSLVCVDWHLVTAISHHDWTRDFEDLDLGKRLLIHLQSHVGLLGQLCVCACSLQGTCTVGLQLQMPMKAFACVSRRAPLEARRAA